MSTYERLKEILKTDYNVPPEKLVPQARLEELGVDSLGVMELLFKIEDEFHVKVGTEHIDLETVDDVVNYIDGLIATPFPETSPNQPVA